MAIQHERQRVRSADDEIRLQLDEDLSSIRSLLGAGNTRFGSSPPPARRRNARSPAMEEVEQVNGSGLALDAEKETVPVASTSKPLLTFIPPAKANGTSTVNKQLLASLLNGNPDDKDHSGPHQAEDAASSALGKASVKSDDRALEVESDDDSDDPYDRFVRELAFEKRAHPSDRLRTELEVAQEAAAELEQSERARLKRMLGDANNGSEDEDEDNDYRGAGASKKRKGKGRGRAPQGDDLDDDDFIPDEGEMDGFGLGGGLTARGVEVDQSRDQAEQVPNADDGEEHSEEDEEGEDGDEDKNENGDEDGDEEESEDEQEETEMLADLLHGEIEQGRPTEQVSLVSSRYEISTAAEKATRKRDELPYTFPCPDSHQHFLEMLECTESDQLETVIQRIRTLHHPSLAEGNKAKLAIFLGVLLDHLLYLSSASDTSSFRHSAILLSHIFSLSHSFPISAAKFCVAKISLMHKNLSHGLQIGLLDESSKTWPGPVELTLLRTIGVLWSTSDFSHPVVAPSMLLICQYLGQCRIRSLQDVTSGLFLCSLVLQYEQQSKRLVPETINFLGQGILLLLPNILDQYNAVIPGSFPMPDLYRAELDSLMLTDSNSIHDRMAIDLLQALHASDDDEAMKTQLVLLLLDLLSEFSAMYTTLPAFIEIFDPISMFMQSARINAIPDSVRVSGKSVTF